MMKILHVLLLLWVVSTVYGCSTQQTMREGADNNALVSSGNESGQEKRITVNNMNFRVKIYGKGDVTIIFENGIALPLETWWSIDDAVAEFTQVFLYDRAGIGQSSQSPLARTIPNYVAELKRLLQHQDILPPYIFVAHSMGGYIARYYAWKYPVDVVGLLPIDPAPESLYDSLPPQELTQYLEKGDTYYSQKSRGSQLEWESLYNNRTFMYQTEIHDSIPIILLSSSEGKMTAYQKQIVENHANTEFIEVAGSHFFHNDHPERIVEYIRKLWGTAMRSK